jgi:hypothetical protein
MHIHGRFEGYTFAKLAIAKPKITKANLSQPSKPYVPCVIQSNLTQPILTAPD